MPYNTDNIIKLYESGMSVKNIAKNLRMNNTKVAPILKAAGIEVANKLIRKLPESEIITAFNSGDSVKLIAARFDCARHVIGRILKANEINPRNSSESMYKRMQQATEEERKAITKKAHETVRNMPKSYFDNILSKAAITKQTTGSKIGIGEQECYKMLQINGFNPIAQFYFGNYNIDIACGNIAIEIHRNPALPHTHVAYRKRIINLLKSGWNVIYIKFRASFIQDAAFDQLKIMLQTASLNPSVRGQYGMINSAGKFFTAAEINGNDLAFMPTSESVFYNSGIY